MTLSVDIVLLASLGYVALLFGVAFWGDWRARQGRLGWLNSPLIYTLSISVYCTSWTFYGAVGSAARNGMEFATIYLGPTLVFIGWWAFLRKIVRVGRAQSVTSIADFLSSRYGKSPWLGALATLVAVVVILPYIGLQLKAVASSFYLITGGFEPGAGHPDGGAAVYRIAFWIAAGLAFFTILFGTRTLDSNERHHGVVAAIALESCVKLLALLAVGLFAVYGVAGGAGAVFAKASPELLHSAEAFDARWAAVTFLSATAIICLPRQFQVTVVECIDESHGRTASWAFPLYLFLISLFVVPLAIVGLTELPKGADPDLFVLTLPLYFGENSLALLVFLGGFSSATSMAIVSCIALSTMVSNHLVMPLALGATKGAASAGDFRAFLLNARRVSIAGIMLLGFLYYRLSGGSDALASIGLISFAGVAQFLPAMIAALYWPRATTRGALAGLSGGFALWFVLLFLPSFQGDLAITAQEMARTLFGDGALMPGAVFGMEGFDPLVHALFWSLSVNTLLLVGVSLTRDASPMERLQSALFTDDDRIAGAGTLIHRSAAVNDLYVLAQRILGGETATRLFDEERRRQQLPKGLPVADDAFIARLERRLASSVGAASAHAMVSQLATGETISLTELMKIADENARILSYSQELEKTSRELADAARQLRAANTQLQEIDAQKDDFLSHVSHELRTPMTSLRAFSEILLSDPDLPPERRRAFIDIIHTESQRLTRLLDQILDMGQLDRGEMSLRMVEVDPEAVIDRAVDAFQALSATGKVEITRQGRLEEARISADPDRLQQVLMNVLSNSFKYNGRPDAKIWIETRRVAGGEGSGEHGWFEILIADNGPGVPQDEREKIFSRFARATGALGAQGVGLGLAISRQIMAAHAGAIDVIESPHEGACFRIRAPELESAARQAAE